MLGDRIGVQRVILKDKERFVVLYEKPENGIKSGYMFSSTSPMTEDELIEKLAEVGATPFDCARILREARANASQ